MTANVELTLDLETNGTFHFESVSAAKKWVADELSGWGWLASVQPALHAQYRRVGKEFLSRLDQLAEGQTSWIAAVDAYRNAYTSLVHHESPKGRFVLDLRSQGNGVAGAALAMLVGVDVHGAGTSDALRGSVQALIYTATIPTDARVAAEALNARRLEFQAASSKLLDVIRGEVDVALAARHELLQQMQRIRAQQEDSVNQTELRLNQVRDQLNSVSADVKQTATEVMEKTSSDLASLLARSDERLNAIAATFEKKLALQTSVAYWTQKRESHRTMCFVWGGAFAVCLLSLVGYTHTAMTAGDSTESLIPEVVSWSTFPLGSVLKFGLMITFGLWAAKMLSRLLLSNLHLHADAAERVVMVTTYLALLKEHAALKEEDRKSIVEALFRKSSTGMLRDDGGPPLLVADMLKPNR